MRNFVFFVLSVVCLSGVTPAVAQTTGGSVSSGEIIPPYVASFAKPPAELDLTAAGDDASLRASFSATSGLSGWDDENASSGSKRRYLPVLYSLLIPGTGEIAMGYPKRGVGLIALEVIAWTGYAYYNNKGLDGRAEFEAFADAHWNYNKWIQDHNAVAGLPTNMRTFEVLDSIGQYHWPSENWPGYHSYAAKGGVKLNYYENIGKYDWFISGWADWDPGSQPRNTSLRDQYRALRHDSNSDLDTADKFIYLSVVTRVFSLVETAILAHRKGRGGEAGASEQRSYSFNTRSTGLASGEVSFVYSF